MTDLERLYGPDRHKSYTSSFVVGFGISLLLMIGYILGYWLFFLLFSGVFPETGPALVVWIPPLCVGITVSVLACIPMRYMKKTVVIPIGMGFLAFYYVVMALGLVTSGETADSLTALYVVSLFCLPCIIPGNVFAWIVWRRFPGTKEEEL